VTGEEARAIAALLDEVMAPYRWVEEALSDAYRAVQQDRPADAAKEALNVRKYLRAMDEAAARAMTLAMDVMNGEG
jgi:hypothetical protein